MVHYGRGGPTYPSWSRSFYELGFVLGVLGGMRA